MVIVGYYTHGNKHYVAFNGDEEHPDRFMITDYSRHKTMAPTAKIASKRSIVIFIKRACK